MKLTPVPEDLFITWSSLEPWIRHHEFTWVHWEIHRRHHKGMEMGSDFMRLYSSVTQGAKWLIALQMNGVATESFHQGPTTAEGTHSYPDKVCYDIIGSCTWLTNTLRKFQRYNKADLRELFPLEMLGKHQRGLTLGIQKLYLIRNDFPQIFSCIVLLFSVIPTVGRVYSRLADPKKEAY